MFVCAPCPKCCGDKQYIAGCKKKECKGYQSCPSEMTTTTSAITDAPSGPPAPSTSALQLRTSRVPAQTLPQGTKTPTQLPTPSSAFIPHAEMLITVESELLSDTSPNSWTTLRSQVFGTEKTHPTEKQDNYFFMYVVVILIVTLFVALLLVVVCVNLPCNRWRSFYKHPVTSTNTGDEETRTRESTSIGDEETMTRESTSIGDEQTRTRESTSIGDEQTRTRESSSIGDEETMTRESTGTGDEETRTRESTSTGDRETRTRESTSNGDEQTKTQESTSIDDEETKTRESASTGDEETRTRESTGISDEQTRTRESTSAGDEETRTQESTLVFSGKMTLRELEGIHPEILDEVCRELDQEKRLGKFDFERLAAKYDRISLSERNSLRTAFHTSGDSPSRDLINLLLAKYPEITVEYFMKTLTEIKRVDLGLMLKPYIYKHDRANRSWH